MSRVAVIGTGNIAYLATQVLLNMGLQPIVVARRGSPKATYFKKLNVDIIYVDEAREYVARYTLEGLGFDMVFEDSGSTEGLEPAIEITRPRGVIHLKSTPGALFKADMTKAVVKELRIIGTRCGTFREFRRSVEMLKSGAVKPLITSVLHGIENGLEAFKKSLSREEIKVVLRL